MNRKTLETMFEKINPDNELVEHTKKLMESAAVRGAKKRRKRAHAFQPNPVAFLAVAAAAILFVIVMKMPFTYDGYFAEKSGFTEIREPSISLYSYPEDGGVLVQEGLNKPDLKNESSVLKFQDEFSSFAKAESGDDCRILVVEGRIVSLRTYKAKEIDKYNIYGFHMMQIDIDSIGSTGNSPGKYKAGDSITAFYYLKDSSKANEKPFIGKSYKMYLYTGKNGDPADKTGKSVGIRKSWILSAAFRAGAD